MEDKVREHLDALADGNWDAYRAGLADNAVYEEIATGQKAEGADNYVNMIKRWKRAFPDLRATVREAFTSGDRVIVELEWEGTHRGQLDAPFGSIPPTNKSGRVRAVLVNRLENGKIVESRNYFDLFSLMRQLGLAPGMGAPEQAARPEEAARH